MRVPCFVHFLVIAHMSSTVFAQCDRDKQQQAIAALGMQVKVRFDDYHIPYLMEGNIAQRSSGDPVDSAHTTLRAIAPLYCVSAADDFTFSGTMSKPDDLGQTFVEIRQTYRGVEVIGPSLRVHLTHDAVKSIRGTFRPEITVSMDPVLTSQEAVRSVLNDIARRGGISHRLRGVRGPVVYVNDQDKVCLAYSVRVEYVVDVRNRYIGGRHIDDIFVNAVTGTVAGRYPLIRKDP